MPTGYTAKLHDGHEQTFPEFLMDCARAFGALITMRDNPKDAEIPDGFEPSPLYRDWLERDRARLARVEAWTDADADREAAAAHQQALDYWKDSQAKTAAMRERYEAMLAKVAAWTPPTPDHEGVKKFMHDQLTESIRFDCGRDSPEPERLDGRSFKEQELARLRRSVEVDEKQWAEEVQRAKERTEWVRALRRSVEEMSSATVA